ncbi:MAG TPA: DUF4365 domain-containing protein [Kofleriaceae bacterium]|nr:DUF4365 domain-containing protein [Kofleriaceae bacterium]
MPMHSTQQKEQFSIAYLRAIVAVAGYNITSVEVDEDSIDIGLRGTRRDGTLRKAPVLDVQAKCTSSDDGHGLHLAFDLPVKNNDDLRESSRHVPLILVVVCVPQDLGDWLEETPEHTAMRRCAYWLSIRGQPPTTNTTTCRVLVPRSQRFTVGAVREMMNRLGDGGMP